MAIFTPEAADDYGDLRDPFTLKKTLAALERRIDVIDELRTGPSGQGLGGGRVAIAAFRITRANFVAITATQTSRIKHVALTDCADLRLVYANPLNRESAGSGYDMRIKVAVEFDGDIFPVTFDGERTAVLRPNGMSLTSDVIPLDLGAGDAFYTRIYTTSEFGPYITTNAAITAGDTQFTSASLPPVGGAEYRGDIRIDAETVLITDITGSGPYTYTVESAFGSNHNSGAAFALPLVLNTVIYGVDGEGQVGQQDRVDSGTIPVGGDATTTLAAAATAGDVSISVQGNIPTESGITVDGEAVQVVNITGPSAPYTYWLAAPLASDHASGTSIVATGLGANLGLAPIAIMADVAPSPTEPVAIMGDSIADGSMYYGTKTADSFIARALQDAGRPYFKVTKAGEAAYQFKDPTLSIYRRETLSLARWVVYQYGVNDIYGASTAETLMADSVEIWTSLRRRGIRVAVCTLTPRTTSNDGWTSLSGQTVVGSGHARRLTYNSWVRDLCPIDPADGTAAAPGTADAVRAGDPAHPVVAIFDVADTVESARDSGLWKVDDDGPLTSDGIHPHMRGHTLMMVAINPSVLSFAAS